MEVTHRSAADYLSMPWKNGGGRTKQLAIFPQSASFADPFLWRLSLAEISLSGPFSTFPGYDRHLVQVSGGPLRLDHGESGARDLGLEQPYCFSGDLSTSCILQNGPAQDVNLMVRRDTAYGDLKVNSIEANSTLHWLLDADFTAVFILSGHVSTQQKGFSQLKLGDILIFATAAEDRKNARNPATLELRASEPTTVIFAEVRVRR
ncbi:MAG: HutD family protein [Proteobacteria bacterium]|nr:HutD family protein [Pseudomonadota bacterium]